MRIAINRIAVAHLPVASVPASNERMCIDTAGDTGDFGSFSGMGSETGWITGITSKLTSAGPAALLQHTSVIASAFAVKTAIETVKIAERKGFLKRVFDVLHPKAADGELTKWQKARRKIGEKLATFSAPALLCGAIVGQIALSQANGGSIVKFLGLKGSLVYVCLSTQKKSRTHTHVLSCRRYGKGCGYVAHPQHCRRNVCIQR